MIGVLIVDDDRRVRTGLRQTFDLEADLVTVADAADADAAMTRALEARVRPLVVLVDVLLPDATSGLALMRALKRWNQCAVVAMSVRGAFRDAALAAGAVAFVEKNSNVAMIVESVRAAASSRPDSGTA